MTVNASIAIGDYTDKVLWIMVRFFLLSTEISVVIFGLAFGKCFVIFHFTLITSLFIGHLDSKTSIRRVLMATSFISLGFSITQGVIEFVSPDETFYIYSENFSLFGHGGMMFWFISSLIFALVIFNFIVSLTSSSNILPEF